MFNISIYFKRIYMIKLFLFIKKTYIVYFLVMRRLFIEINELNTYNKKIYNFPLFYFMAFY